MRFIVSPPGKRRHNELNAAPPPETPRRTGKPGETNNRDVVHSRESFLIRGKTCLLSEPRGMIPLCLPLEGKAIQFAAERLTVRALTCLRCAACTDPSPAPANKKRTITPHITYNQPTSRQMKCIFFLNTIKSGEKLLIFFRKSIMIAYVGNNESMRGKKRRRHI